MPETPSRIYDPLRRKMVADTPEERVRQWFIGQLGQIAQVPEWLMMSEVQMTFGQKSWRADILVYSRDAKPLAVVECKRPDVKIDAAVAEQALRYHAVQNVKFIFLTNGTSTYIYRKEDAGFTPLGHFPTYQEMNTECPR